jgi:hypothetical protein
VAGLQNENQIQLPGRATVCAGGGAAVANATALSVDGDTEGGLNRDGEGDDCEQLLHGGGCRSA